MWMTYHQLRAIMKCGKIFWISISDISHKNVRQSFLKAPQSGSEFEACWWSIAALCGKDLSNWWGRAGDWCTIFNLLQKSQDRWLPCLALFSGGIIGQTIHSLWNDVEKIKSPREKNAETIKFFQCWLWLKTLFYSEYFFRPSKYSTSARENVKTQVENQKLSSGSSSPQSSVSTFERTPSNPKNEK